MSGIKWSEGETSKIASLSFAIAYKVAAKIAGAVFLLSGSMSIGPGSMPIFCNCSDTINLKSEFVTVICFSNKI